MEKSKASFVMRSSEESWSMHKSVNQWPRFDYLLYQVGIDNIFKLWLKIK